MKVCQLCAVDFTVKHFLLPIIDGMLARGWQVTTVCSEGQYVAGLRQQGYSLETICIARSANPIKALSSIRQLIALFRQEQFDVVHVHTPVAALIGRIAAKWVGVPMIVYTAHGFYFHDQMHPLKRWLFVAIERLAGRVTDLLFSVSGEDAEFAAQNGIVAADSIMTVGNGVDTSRFDPFLFTDRSLIRRRIGIPEHAFLVCMAGRLVREKGVVEFLQAAELLQAENANLWFLLVGERLKSDHDFSVDRELNNAQKKLGGRLVSLGLRSDMPEILAAIDVFCLPSWREGMPVSIIEAMMMAKPIVATRIRGSREEVVDGETGILVDTLSPKQLADAILKFANDREFAQNAGDAGRQRALQLYDIKQVVSVQLDRIEQLARVSNLLS